MPLPDPAWAKETLAFLSGPGLFNSRLGTAGIDNRKLPARRRSHPRAATTTDDGATTRRNAAYDAHRNRDDEVGDDDDDDADAGEEAA